MVAVAAARLGDCVEPADSAFRAAVGGSGQEGASLATALAMRSSHAMAVPVPEAGQQT